MILLNIDVKSILRAKRADTPFRATIEGSIRLDRRCCFIPQKPDPTAPWTSYNLNRLIAAQDLRLGMYPLLQWPINKGQIHLGRDYRRGVPALSDEDKFLVDVRFRCWGAVVNSIGENRSSSCDTMLVLQPPHPVGVVWSVGFFTPMREGGPLFKDQRLKQWTFKYEDGRLPRFGELKQVLVERLGVVGRVQDLDSDVDEDDEVGASDAVRNKSPETS